MLKYFYLNKTTSKKQKNIKNLKINNLENN